MVLFPGIQTSQLDGRAQAFRHKQAQFHRLYEVLTRSASALKLAIQADSFLSSTEVDFEFAQTLSELRLHYESLDLQKDLKAARQVETGAENVERTRPVGIVYIVPSTSSLAFSVLSALGAAVAAGSCVIVELPQTLMQTSAALRKVLTEAMDTDTFAIANSRPPPDFTGKCMLVNQTGEEVNASEWFQVLLSPSRSRSLAVVDRTANLTEAARAVAEANFSFGGKSAYAPQVVLVNEFVADRFLSGLVSQLFGTGHESKSNGHVGQQVREDQKVAKDTPRTENMRTVVSGSNGSILEALDRQASIFTTKRNGPTVVVHRISSLDDGLNVLKGHRPWAACFLFAELPQANYLSRYLDSYICTINHIPVELLVGPVAPTHPCIPSTPSPRYKPAMFTIPAPQYLPKQHLTESLSDPKGQVSVRKLVDKVMQPLPPILQGDGKMLNFFGEAIFVGFGMAAAGIIGVSLGGFWLVFSQFRGR